MPHNRRKRQAEVEAKYEFVVYGGEYSITNAILVAVDAIIAGGNTSYEYLKREVVDLGIDLAAAMAQAGLDPLRETLYFDKFIFENWEKPLGAVKIPLPNKFVPYVAARKRKAV